LTCKEKGDRGKISTLRKGDNNTNESRKNPDSLGKRKRRKKKKERGEKHR